jgi:hypothetical protein
MSLIDHADVTTDSSWDFISSLQYNYTYMAQPDKHEENFQIQHKNKTHLSFPDGNLSAS